MRYQLGGGGLVNQLTNSDPENSGHCILENLIIKISRWSTRAPEEGETIEKFVMDLRRYWLQRIILEHHMTHQCATESFVEFVI